MTDTDMTIEQLASEVAALMLRKEAEARQVNRLERDLADVRDALAQAQKRLKTENDRLAEARERLDFARQIASVERDPTEEAALDAREAQITAWEIIDGS